MTAQIIHMPNAAADVAAARHVLACDGATAGQRIMALTVLDMHGHRDEADAEAARIDAAMTQQQLDDDARALAVATKWVFTVAAAIAIALAVGITADKAAANFIHSSIEGEAQ